MIIAFEFASHDGAEVNLYEVEATYNRLTLAAKLQEIRADVDWDDWESGYLDNILLGYGFKRIKPDVVVDAHQPSDHFHEYEFKRMIEALIQ